jgi:cation diffusion facilitator CzcD-associated flavoprotein CzcO
MKDRTIIIGAGPAGLAAAGQLRHAGLSFEMIEQTDKIASTWHQHYDRLHLHTVKSRSSLPYQDFPNHYPQYISKKQLIDYYEDYAKRLELTPHFNTQVTSVAKTKEGWKIICADDKTFETENVIIATGLNRIPKIPTWKGQDLFQGDMSHASSYKNSSPYLKKKVLVVGMGNTGAEIALDLAEANVDVSISVRSDLVIVPRDFLGRPIQLTAEKLAKLPFGLRDRIGKLAPKISFGNLDKYGLTLSKMSPTKLRLKHGKTPTIDLGTIEKIKEGKIKIYKEIQELEENSIRFVDSKINQFDSIILATGYHAQIDSFLGKDNACLDDKGEPQTKLGRDKAKGLYFIGYEKFTLGGILGTLKDDAALIVNDLKKG